MGRKVPLSEMQGMGDLLPADIYLLEGKEMTSVLSNSGKLMYKTRSEVVEPTEQQGNSFFENFVIGTDADPEAEERATWNSFGGKRFKSMLEASGLEMSDMDDEELAAAWAGQRYLASLTVKTQSATNKDGTPNEFAGDQQNAARRYYAVGEREPGSEGEAKPASRPTPPKTAPAKATAPAKPAAAPARAARPNGADTAPPAPKTAKPAATKSPKMIQCAACEPPQEWPLAEFAAHVESAHPE